MKIGIDLDDCILDTATPIVAKLKDELNIDVNLADIGTYTLEDVYNIDKKVMDRIVDEVLRSDLEPIRNAVNVIKFLSFICDNLYILSFRDVSLLKHTMDNLAKIGLSSSHGSWSNKTAKYEEVPRFTLILSKARDKDGTPAKWKTVNENEIDVVIEDRADTIESLYKKTNATILIFDQPWNRHIKENDRIVVVKDWNEIKNFVMERFH